MWVQLGERGQKKWRQALERRCEEGEWPGGLPALSRPSALNDSKPLEGFQQNNDVIQSKTKQKTPLWLPCCKSVKRLALDTESSQGLLQAPEWRGWCFDQGWAVEVARCGGFLNTL